MSGNRDKLIHDLGSALVEQIEEDRPDWENLAIAVNVAGTRIQVTGFSYDKAGKAEPAGFGGFEIFDAIKALRAAMAEADKDAPWVASLIRINKTSGKIDGDFDYVDPKRWAVDIDDLDASAEKLRPKN